MTSTIFAEATCTICFGPTLQLTGVTYGAVCHECDDYAERQYAAQGGE